jgi:hypothetical protein
VTIRRRDRTLMSCPCSGGEIAPLLIPMSSGADRQSATEDKMADRRVGPCCVKVNYLTLRFQAPKKVEVLPYSERFHRHALHQKVLTFNVKKHRLTIKLGAKSLGGKLA